jgi:hypothetical protein
VKLQKDTVLSLVKGATVFINYLGGCMFYGLLFHIHVVLLLLIQVHSAATYVYFTVFKRAVWVFDPILGHTRSRHPSNTKASLHRMCSRL